MKRLEICPLCDGNLEIGKTIETFLYRGKTVSVEMIGEHCSTCNEGFQNDEDLKINEHNISLAKKAVDRNISSNIARIRKKLGLKQVQAAELFGGGIRAFHKYENGTVQAPLPLLILLDLLDRGELTLEEVKSTLGQEVNIEKTA